MNQSMTEMVLEFHQVYEAYIGDKPALRDKEISKLRIELLREEFNEYCAGVEEGNLVEIADGLADIIYVALGAAISYGIPIDKIFDTVHRSNMSKLGADGKPMRRYDGKILKGPTYFEPKAEITRILRDYGAEI
jgi:predicted HAD superfamily Cof-like phosphohydrolase